MLTLRGAPALSEFRIQKLVAQLGAAGAAPQLSANFMHFVDLDGTLDDHDQRVLERLLDYGPKHGESSDEGSGVRYRLRWEN